MITVLGSINLDLIATCEHLPKPGETVSGLSFDTMPGGKGANQALAASRAYAKVRLVGAVGSDDFAQQALYCLTPAHISLKAVKRQRGATGLAVISVDAHGENTIIIIPGANASIDENMAAEAVEAMNVGDYLLLQQEIPDTATRTALELAKQKGVKTLLNIAPVSENTRELSALADVIIANETEFSDLTGQELNMENAQPQIAEWAQNNNKTMIVTLGSQGVIAATAEKSFALPALPITPIDTVGAGDTFCGYLAAALDAGQDLEAAVGRAAIAGSLACLKPGAQPAIPHAPEVNAHSA